MLNQSCRLTAVCCHFVIGTQVSTKKKILIDDGVQCNIANLPPLSLLSKSSVKYREDEALKPLCPEDLPEEVPFEDADVDDEDYNRSLDSEEDEDELDEVKPKGWLPQFCKYF